MELGGAFRLLTNRSAGTQDEDIAMDDLLNEFLTETAENMEILEMELVKLEQNPNDLAVLGNIFRLVHTTKGNCRFLGLPRLESVAHAVENILEKIRDGGIDVTRVAVSLLLEGIDRIKLLLHELEAYEEEPEGEDNDLISRLNAFAAGNVVEAAEDMPATANECPGPSIVTGPGAAARKPPAELQEVGMKTRLQPIGNAWSKLPHLVRGLSIELDKKIDLQMIGADVELDRQVLELIRGPLIHMVRNAADHGIEKPTDRLAGGKTETGTITLNAYHEGDHICIEIRDDGKGLNTARIREKVLEAGLVPENVMRRLSTQQIQQFVFHAGLSTAATVTFVSGRGVGMDVVKMNIEKIGGTVELQSTEGVGTTISLRIPLTLAMGSARNAERAGEHLLPPVSIAANPSCTLARSSFRVHGPRIDADAAPDAAPAVTGSRCKPGAGQKIGPYAGKSGVTL